MKIVVQFSADFMGPDFLTEAVAIRRLFDRAGGAFYFTGETKRQVGEKLKRSAGPARFLLIGCPADVYDLANSPEDEPVDAEPIANELGFREQQRLKKIQQYVREHSHEPIDMQAVVALTQLSNAAFCRYFKKATGSTFTDYLNRYRIGAGGILSRSKTAR